jgi:DNA-binding NarL/FixJ family response regulator
MAHGNATRLKSDSDIDVTTGDQLLAALDGGVIMMDCDGAAYVIDGRGSISAIAASDQVIGLICALIASPATDRPAAKKLTALLGMVRQETLASAGRLTFRERQILGLICRGASDPAMADRLGLSPNTIRNHVASLYRKLRVHSRSAAVIWAYQQGIAEDGNASAAAADERK